MNKEEKKYCENDVKATKKACKKIFKSEKTKRIAKKVGIFAAGAAAGAVGAVVIGKKIKYGGKGSVTIGVDNYNSKGVDYVGIELYRNDLLKIFGEKPFRMGGGWTPEHALEIGNTIIEYAKELTESTGE